MFSPQKAHEKGNFLIKKHSHKQALKLTLINAKTAHKSDQEEKISEFLLFRIPLIASYL